MINFATHTIFKSSSLELKDLKVSDPKVRLKSEFAKKKSLRLRFVKVGIGHPPAQTPMSGPITSGIQEGGWGVSAYADIADTG